MVRWLTVNGHLHPTNATPPRLLGSSVPIRCPSHLLSSWAPWRGAGCGPFWGDGLPPPSLSCLDEKEEASRLPLLGGPLFERTTDDERSGSNRCAASISQLRDSAGILSLAGWVTGLRYSGRRGSGSDQPPSATPDYAPGAVNLVLPHLLRSLQLYTNEEPTWAGSPRSFNGLAVGNSRSGMRRRAR